MTEVSPLLTTLLPEEHCLENTDRPFAPVKSAGKPVLGVEVRVVDYNDSDVPTGAVGEIIARGPNVMRGYWKRPEITADALRGGWMHTGDMGSFDDQGFLYILDRKKDMIKPGGENVYSPEVESVVAAHPSVLEAAVIGIPDEKWGEAVRAVVALRPGAALSEHDLIDWCKSQLTHFKCPTSVIFAAALPKGGTGKIQKTILRQLYGGAASAQSAS
jgi:long-chain acyl-CoA synthetase